MRILRLTESLAVADSVRGLAKAASGMPLSEAVADLAKALRGMPGKWALYGGLAVGVHARPRGTDDIDIVITDEGNLDEFFRLTSMTFKKTKGHAMAHKRTGVEVEALTPEFLKIPADLVAKVLNTAKPASVGGAQVSVVSREGLVAMKLFRGEDYDRGDIKSVLRSGGPVDLSGWPLDTRAAALLDTIKVELTGEKPIEDKEIDR